MEFGAWLEQEGLQAIATRVSTGEECSVIIQDGYSIAPESFENGLSNGAMNGALNTIAPTWQNGF